MERAGIASLQFRPTPLSYRKSPLTSTIKSTVPPELLKTENVALPLERDTIALLARVRPARKLIVLAFGRVMSDLNTTSSPGAPTFVTVRFAEIATAPTGMPHGATDMSNVRVAPGSKDGAPSGPA